MSCCNVKFIPEGVAAVGRCGDSSASCSDAYDGSDSELPEHEVRINEFYIDTFEVTVGRFRKYVEVYDVDPSTRPVVGSGAHPLIDGSGWQGAWTNQLPESSSALLAQINGDGATWTDGAGDNEQYPINRMTWYQAFAFCIWDGGRLPTEAEWEYVSSGGKDNNRLFPWGSASPSGDPQRANSNATADSQYVEVGSYPAGASIWGVHDLAGSMTEWVLDLYSSDWYQSIQSTYDNAANLNVGDTRVRKGGCYNNGASNLRVARRYAYRPTIVHREYGFRCVYNF